MRILFSAIFTMIFSFQCFAVIQAGAVWEFRSTATNTNVNGGAYDSTIAGAGTDYTLQDAAQIALTDISCTQNVVTVNSAAGLFTPQMVGNAIQMASGTNIVPGFYFMTEYISSKIAKFDRTMATAGNGSSGVGKLGGALYLPTDALLENAVSGNMIWVKYGTYSLTGAINIGTAVGQQTNPVHFVGYQTTRGDMPTLANRPTIACGANQLTFGQYWSVRNFIFTGTKASSSIVVTGTGTHFQNSNINNTNATSPTGLAASNSAIIFGCEAQAASGTALITGDATQVFNTYIHDSTIGASGGSNASPRFFGCVFDKNTTGFTQTAASRAGCIFLNNVFYDNTTHLNSTATALKTAIIQGNIFHTSTNAITDSAANYGLFMYQNLFYNNVTDVNNVGTLNSTNITGQDPKMTNPDAGDFTLESGSPALNAGWNFANSGLTGAYNWNIGVDQDDVSAAAASAHSWAY